MSHSSKPVAGTRPFIWFFSGKGGVGKTTVAVATALSLAKQGKKTLLISTDPAHNLADVLALPVGGDITHIDEALDAVELSAAAYLTQAAGAISGSGGAAALLRPAFELMSEMPGIDELLGIEVLMQLIESTNYDVLVIDTAPTGHTLRLLAAPRVMESWVGLMLSWRSKFARVEKMWRRWFSSEPASDPFDLEQDLSASQKRLGALRQLLADRSRAAIMLVSIAEPLSVAETARTCDFLRQAALPLFGVVMNQIQPQASACPHCAFRRQMHLEQVNRLKNLIGTDIMMALVESLPQELRGVESLREFGKRLEYLWPGVGCSLE